MRLPKQTRLRVLPYLTIIVTIFVLGLVLACAQRPRRVGHQTTITVKAGDDLQAAIDKANLGDTVIVQAGATFTGPLHLRDKGPGSGTGADYIMIRTSDLAGISPEGERVSPAKHAQSMPKIVAPNEQAAVDTAPQAHHYKFVGFEFVPAANSKYVYNLIDLGQSNYTSLSQYPHHLVFDRCYIHSPGLNRARRGVALNSAETSVINSYVSGFAGAGDETQAIAGWNGPGPFHIVNNFLQGGGEILIFGGADPSIPNLVPSDIEIRRNHLHRPLEWNNKATIKGSFELKNARRVLFDGNLIDSEIRATAIVITTRNQNGKAPWSIIEDLQITNNIVRHATTGVNFLASDNEHNSQEARRVRIANNLFLDIVSERQGDTAYFLQINGGSSITIEHNTVQQEGNTISAYGTPTRQFVFRDNIVQFNLYGIVCLNSGPACPRENYFCHCMPGALVTRNVIIDNAGSAGNDRVEGKYPMGNFFVSSFAKVGFVDYRQGNWRLASNSSYRSRGSDGKDPGVDFDILGASGVNSAVEGSAFVARPLD